MKYFLIGIVIVAFTSFSEPGNNASATAVPPADSSQKIIIITLDGYRRQELFTGADSRIINDSNFTSDPEMLSSMYGGATAEERRNKLMPFLWRVAVEKGQLYGNREYNNQVNVSNLYDISYAGYNEMFTGTTDLRLWSNDKVNNNNKNIFEFLAAKENFKGKIALFTSWDVFPFILNEKRSGLKLNSGYENLPEENEGQKLINIVQDSIEEKGHTRRDMLTYLAAKEYLQAHRPRLLYLGLGETDEYAHHGNYDMYLQRANEADHIISELWHWAQTTEGYKNNTTFIITTDHGRGISPAEWTSHGTFVKGSSQAWLLLFGKGVEAKSEIKTAGSIYQKQLAQTIAHLAGENFGRQAAIDFAAN